MTRFIIFSLLILGISFAVPKAAGAETPEQFSARYMDSIRQNGMKDLAALVHPDELKKLAELVVEIVDTAKSSGKTGTIPFLKGDESVESLRKLPPADIAERFFAWIGEMAPQLTQMLRTAEAKPIGHVTDGDTVYVVAKLSFTMEGELITGTDVLPLRRDGDSYKALLKAEMTGILKAMKKAAGEKGKK